MAYLFLYWNLFLAWVPYVWSLVAVSTYRRYPRDCWALLLLGALWLLFFPNAPYILTDFVHLRPSPQVPLWYDVALLGSFAWCGCFLAVASLHIMQALVRAFAGRMASWLFVLATAGLSGVGIYFGRFLNWNSWDVFVNPRELWSVGLTWLADPFSHHRAFGFAAVFAAFLLACYVTFSSQPAIRMAEPVRD